MITWYEQQPTGVISSRLTIVTLTSKLLWQQGYHQVKFFSGLNLLTSEHGIQIQIYTSLLAYVLLQLVVITKEFSGKLLDKLRYLQAFMSENISYVHWFRRLVVC